MWLLGVITDIVLYFLLVMVRVGIFIWGGGFGVAILVIINNLYFYWFPSKRTIGETVERFSDRIWRISKFCEGRMISERGENNFG